MSRYLVGALAGLAFGLGTGLVLQQSGLLPPGWVAAVAVIFVGVGLLRAWAGRQGG